MVNSQKNEVVISQVDFATARRWYAEEGRIKTPLQALESLNRRGKLADKNQLDFLAKLRGYSSLKGGFSFIPNRRPVTIKTQENHLLYCLHQSVPYTTNGYSTRSHGIAVGLQQAGFKVRATTRLGFPWEASTSKLKENFYEIELDNVTYVAVDGLRLLSNPLDEYIYNTAEHFLNQAKEYGAQVIVAASNHITALPALLAARSLGIPFVYEVRGLWEVTQASIQLQWADSEHYQLMRELEQQAAVEADLVITLTEELAEELTGWGIARERIKLVPNAVDAKRFQPMAADIDIINELNLPSGVPVIGYAGSAVAYEGLELLIEALALLKKRGQNFIFVLVGDGAVIDKLKVTAETLGIAEECRFTGRVSFEEVPRYLSCMDITPIPRLSSTVTEMISALKPLEAMAMGKAVILSDVSPNITMAGSENERALLFKKDCVDALCDALQMLMNSPEECERLGVAARDWIENERTWSRVSHHYAKAIKEILL